MSDNVIILGAGFSYDSGIPLLGNFFETIWEIAMRKSHNGKKISDSDVIVFDAAVAAQNHLNDYHGRVNLQDRNIEDILSILNFASMAGDEVAKKHQEAIIKAITRTIELSCSTKHQGISAQGQSDTLNLTGHESYRDFWKTFLRRAISGQPIPPIITFNYDLVLERSLMQVLIGEQITENGYPFHDIWLKYHYENIPSEIWRIHNCIFQKPTRGGIERFTRTRLTKSNIQSGSMMELEILKLHGSLNFPSEKWPDDKNFNVAEVLDQPKILPPIFNKMTTDAPVAGMWKIAMERLRSAKNVIIVGYSLPSTDIYMQYFLKSALGPNQNLNKIFVFDPVLFSDCEAAENMKNRYAACFSPQLRSRIFFQPNSKKVISNDILRGSTQHFIQILKHSPESILF